MAQLRQRKRGPSKGGEGGQTLKTWKKSSSVGKTWNEIAGEGIQVISKGVNVSWYANPAASGCPRGTKRSETKKSIPKWVKTLRAQK